MFTGFTDVLVPDDGSRRTSQLRFRRKAGVSMTSRPLLSLRLLVTIAEREVSELMVPSDLRFKRNVKYTGRTSACTHKCARNVRFWGQADMPGQAE